ncbi:hypothetical protein [Paraburkholderia sacchari]|uniref:Uncharacterized protein n=1 Tax=Paraburkholderia sacchari TaxID=159450 RepID=A0A8T6ZBG9_9BURK|nr:hypothetical protein [Paraburkholderia sacchari]NLP62096.1 hypothetical protein [Paraburkholderia sacchari]
MRVSERYGKNGYKTGETIHYSSSEYIWKGAVPLLIGCAIALYIVWQGYQEQRKIDAVKLTSQDYSIYKRLRDKSIEEQKDNIATIKKYDHLRHTVCTTSVHTDDYDNKQCDIYERVERMPGDFVEVRTTVYEKYGQALSNFECKGAPNWCSLTGKLERYYSQQYSDPVARVRAEAAVQKWGDIQVMH